ncbi:MAG: hypothetical protein ACPGJV_07060 [Bacteriovoracaceae bacterium]
MKLKLHLYVIALIVSGLLTQHALGNQVSPKKLKKDHDIYSELLSGLESWAKKESLTEQNKKEAEDQQWLSTQLKDQKKKNRSKTAFLPDDIEENPTQSRPSGPLEDEISIQQSAIKKDSKPGTRKLRVRSR